jgi:hypothetical protein
MSAKAHAWSYQLVSSGVSRSCSCTIAAGSPEATSKGSPRRAALTRAERWLSARAAVLKHFECGLPPVDHRTS